MSEYGYGLWALVVFNPLLFIVFALNPPSRRDAYAGETRRFLPRLRELHKGASREQAAGVVPRTREVAP